MRIFAAALNLIVFTSAISLQEKESNQNCKSQAGAIWDECKGNPACVVGKLGELGLSKDVQKAISGFMAAGKE